MTYNGYHIGGVDMIWCLLVFVVMFLALATASVIPGLWKRKAAVYKTTVPPIHDHLSDINQGNENVMSRNNL